MLQYGVASLCNQLLSEYSGNQFETLHRCFMTPPRSGKLRENPFLNELHEEKPNFQNRDFADSIKCQSGNIAYIPSEPNAHGFLLVT